MVERLYEGMFLLDANETAKDWSELESHVKTLLSKNQARLEYGERWPDQKLAYEIKGVRKGTYYLTYFRAATERIADLRRDVELSEHILRLLVVQEEFLEEEMERRREAAARRSTPQPETPAASEGEPNRTPAKVEASEKEPAEQAVPEVDPATGKEPGSEGEPAMEEIASEGEAGSDDEK